MGIGLFISALSPTMMTANAITPAFVMPFVMFGGFIANNDRVPDWLSWVQWLSPIRYGNEAISHIVFDDAHYWIGTPSRQVDVPQEYLQMVGFNVGYWKCIICMLAFVFIWRIMSLIALRISVRKF